MNAAYQQYLNSPHWQTLRARKCKERCTICGVEGPTDRHHLRYRNLYDVEKRDLRNVCRRCHDVIHDLKLRFPESWSHQKVFAHTGFKF